MVKKVSIISAIFFTSCFIKGFCFSHPENANCYFHPSAGEAKLHDGLFCFILLSGALIATQEGVGLGQIPCYEYMNSAISFHRGAAEKVTASVPLSMVTLKAVS